MHIVFSFMLTPKYLKLDACKTHIQLLYITIIINRSSRFMTNLDEKTFSLRLSCTRDKDATGHQQHVQRNVHISHIFNAVIAME